MAVTDKHVAVLVESHFEDSELAEPMEALKEAGADVTVVGTEAAKEYEGKKGSESVTSDVAADEVSAGDFDAVVVPGGKAPEQMRMNEAMVQLIAEMDAAGKPIAAICHGAQLLISADILRGRKATCYKTIRDDVKNAGAEYVDEVVVIDENLITSRQPSDIPQFNEAIIAALSD